MKLDRRQFFRLTAGGAATAATVAIAAPTARADRVPDGDVGMLFDATRCIGCKACMVACKRSHDFPAESSTEAGLWDDPVDLSSKTKTIIKLVDDSPVFVKSQCMHCVRPACVSVCMLGAMHVGEAGVVAYDPGLCIGCRYCQIACAYNVPKFEWDEPIPHIVKCELCSHRVEGPACCEVCPREAVVFGTRNGLLAEARRRIAAEPDRYVDRIYGEYEGGGTHVLYLSGVPFEDLGLPDLDDHPVAELSETIQHGLYRGMVAPAVLYGALATVMWRNRSDPDEPEGPGDESSLAKPEQPGGGAP